MVKRVREGPIFSKEPGNLRNLHSFKYSGLANEKTIQVTDTPAGIQIVTRKPGAGPHSVKSAYVTSYIRQRSGGRRALGVTANVTTRKQYRVDLRPAVLARVSALTAAQKEPKPTRAKKLRGKKAAAAAASEAL